MITTEHYLVCQLSYELPSINPMKISFHLSKSVVMKVYEQTRHDDFGKWLTISANITTSSCTNNVYA